MHQNKKLPPALKHGVYSTTALLPGESRTAFEKLHRDLIDELSPTGALEKDTVATIARLLWRKQNLVTLRIADFALGRYEAIKYEKLLEAGVSVAADGVVTPKAPSDAELEAVEAAENQARKELAETYELVDVGDGATVEQLLEDLSVQERLDAMIDKCLKRLAHLRGVKSLAPTQSASPSSAQASSAPVRRLRLT
jgi:hypothetical protein